MFQTQYKNKGYEVPKPTELPSLTKPDQSLTILELFERHTRRVGEIPHRQGIYTGDFIPPNYGDKAEKTAYLLDLQEQQSQLSYEIQEVINDLEQQEDESESRFQQSASGDDLQSTDKKPVQKTEKSEESD